MIWSGPCYIASEFCSLKASTHDGLIAIGTKVYIIYDRTGTPDTLCFTIVCTGMTIMCAVDESRYIIGSLTLLLSGRVLALDLCAGVFFFFSSRRRHTRSLCDWSSDVCSSD